MKKLICRCLAAAVVLAASVPLLAASATNRPNIIFILADDLGYGDVGVFYQNSRPSSKPRMVTPQLDTMAAQGLMFRQHYSSCPVCAPARASLLLGQHQGSCSIRDNQFDKALPNNHTLATVLKQAGYYCGAVGKWGLAGQTNLPPLFTNVTVTVPGYPLQHGFDEFFGFVDHGAGHVYYHDSGHPLYQDYTNVTTTYQNIYSTDLFFARAKKFVTDRAAASPSQPFFLYLAPTAVHAALQVPGGPYPTGSGTNGGLHWPLAATPATVDTWIHPDYTNAMVSGTNWNDIEKRYATMDRRLDDGIGDLLQLLRDLGLATNTLVVFSSDNGPANEADGGPYASDPRLFDSWATMDGIKRDLWEAGVREPTIAWWPGTVAAGGASDLVSAFWDWMPTFADLTGQAPPAQSDGVSLLPTLTGVGTQRSRGFWYFEYYYNGTFPVDGGTGGLFARKDVTARNQLQSIRSGNFVAVRYNITNATDPFRLYNVVADPHEDTDLSGFATNATLLAGLSNLVADVRRPEPSAPRPYDSQLVPAVSGVLATNGLLDYATYSGAWPWVPDLAALTAVSTGKVAGLDLSVSTLSNNFGISFDGYLLIPNDGQYTFYLTDDSGAQMWLHEAHLIDDDYNHSGAEVSASVLLKAGLHPLRLFYRHSTGPRALDLQYAGPSIAKQAVPQTMFYSSCPTCISPPIALDDDAATPQGNAVTINVLGNDVAGSGPGPLRVISVGTPGGGRAATNLAGQVIYTPNASFLGDDSFTYTMSDGLHTASAAVHVNVYFSDGSLWFPFNQTSGLTTDEAGEAYTASLIGFPDETSQWVAGKWNQAIQFDGAANYLGINGYTGILGSDSRTCAAWVKTTSTQQMPVIAWGPDVAGNKWTFLIQNGHARIEITSGYIEGTRLVNDGQWHHVAVTYTNNFSSITNAKLYVDGTVETSFTTTLSRTVNTTSSGNVKIGSDVQSRYFSGVMDEPHVFNRALSAAEIVSLMNGTNQSAAAWYRRYYGNAPIDWSALDSAGHPRLLDYAMGSQPWISSPAQLSIGAQVVGGHLQILFPRRVAGTSELLYMPQVSTNLTDWTTLTASLVSAMPLANLPGFEQAVFQADPALTQECALYMRLRVGFQ